MAEFRTEEELRGWLTRHDHQVHICFAARCALRKLPRFGLAPDQANATVAINCYRAVLVSVVAAKFPHIDMTSYAELASSALRAAAGPNLNALPYDNYAAVHAADTINSETSVWAAGRAAGAEATPGSVTEGQRCDASKIDESDDPSDVFDTPLWPTQKISEGQPEKHDFLIGVRTETLRTWDFFWRWLDGLSDGNPIDWDVQLAISKLSNEDWEKGLEWLAKRIAEIEARISMERRIRDLQEALIIENRNRHGIGGNYPPEPIENLSQVPGELVVVWEPLTELQQQAQSDEPDIGLVKSAINKLAAIAVSCGAWTWDKANVFLDAALKEAGTKTVRWGVPAVLATVHNDKIIAAIKAALEWVVLL